MAEHRAERDDRHGDDEHDPEQATELRDVIAVTRMPCVPAVARMSGMSLVTRMSRFIGPHMPMILLVVHTPKIYPLGV